ncbi:TRAP transporter large permease [Phyllobacterium sp. 21LDTY02-6]|uniref:TRAP transporter large permease n=1 Tax=unclassified Phyllobacterium TaxID=2638441 RepID=UPI0020203103|nr:MULTISPECIES: TRAP transporter large permease [unclassified Phyllobacterium]MCO4318144.1 TRAP transporter large permease [Phyllobacterium sp. 21LDTY02-6]MCX8280138.1 TRAP transporter large permease [Phyllobacterium sp. 0TCS1.6C]MCX8294300.1 TRAP transporter large permease [Phyllobacterium sp. 0TCS1.6A]
MLLITIVFVILMVVGMPVAFATGIAGFIFFMTTPGMPMSIGVQKIASMSQSFPLLAVPFFVLAGHLMNASGITSRLLKVALVSVGWMSGGLAQVAIVLSTLMGGVSGSAVADAAMEARILGPTMVAKGYGKGFSAAAIAVGSLITATIPPSIGLILYGFVGNVSIGRLFLAGIVPGFLMMAVLMLTTYLIAKKRKYVVADSTRPTLRALGTACWDAKWALLFPVALVLAIRGGLFTPSEVGSAAVVYALVIGFFAHRQLTLEEVWRSFGQATSDVGLIMLIILMSGMVGYATIYMQVPQELAGWMLAGISDPNLIVLVILVFLLVAGLALDSTVMVLLLTPIFVPIIVQLGMDPVHFGILMMSIVTLGGMTWPSGSAMFAVCSLMNVSIEEYSIESIPFIAAIVALIAVLLFVPGLVLWLPNLAFR